MTTTSARDKVKNRFNIPSTETGLDTIIDSCVADAIDMLSGYVRVGATATTTITYGTYEITVTAGRKVTDIWFDDGSGKKVTVIDWYQEDNVVYLTTTLDGTITYRYEVSYDSSSLANLPTEHNQPFLNLCYAEFSGFLAGDRSAYSEYTQSAGARAVDNMRDLSDFYERKADRLFAKVEQSEGA